MVLLSLVGVPHAQAQHPSDELRKEFGAISPAQAQMMAQDCRAALSNMALGVTLLKEREAERQEMLKIAACSRADYVAKQTSEALRGEAGERSADYYALRDAFQDEQKAYQDTFSDYDNPYLLNVMQPHNEYARKCGMDPSKEWNKLGLRLPKEDDLISEKDLQAFLRGISDATDRVRDRCTRLSEGANRPDWWCPRAEPMTLG